MSEPGAVQTEIQGEIAVVKEEIVSGAGMPSTHVFDSENANDKMNANEGVQQGANSTDEQQSNLNAQNASSTAVQQSASTIIASSDMDVDQKDSTRSMNDVPPTTEDEKMKESSMQTEPTTTTTTTTTSTSTSTTVTEEKPAISESTISESTTLEQPSNLQTLSSHLNSTAPTTSAAAPTSSPSLTSSNSLTQSTTLTSSAGGTMITTSIGKKIKINVTKKVVVPPSEEEEKLAQLSQHIRHLETMQMEFSQNSAQSLPYSTPGVYGGLSSPAASSSVLSSSTGLPIQQYASGYVQPVIPGVLPVQQASPSSSSMIGGRKRKSQAISTEYDAPMMGYVNDDYMGSLGMSPGVVSGAYGVTPPPKKKSKATEIDLTGPIYGSVGSPKYGRGGATPAKRGGVGGRSSGSGGSIGGRKSSMTPTLDNDAPYTPGGSSYQSGGRGVSKSSTPKRGGARGSSSSPSSSSQMYSSTPKRTAPSGTPLSRRDLEGTAMGLCFDLISNLMSLPDAPPFNQPVDADALGIPEYHSIITHPMDLRTIKEKIKRNKYANISQFASDVRLVWKNATTFNAAESPVHIMALNLSSYFEEQYRILADQASKLPVQTPSELMGVKSTPQRPSRNAAIPVDQTKLSLEEKIKQLNATLKSAESQLLNLKRNGATQALNRAIDALLSKSSQEPASLPSDTSPLPFELKASLSYLLDTMTAPEHIKAVIQILTDHAFSFPKTGSECTLDIDNASPITLRSIEQYLRANYPQGNQILDSPAPENYISSSNSSTASNVNHGSSDDSSGRMEVDDKDSSLGGSSRQATASTTSGTLSSTSTANNNSNTSSTQASSAHTNSSAKPNQQPSRSKAAYIDDDDSDSDSSESDSDDDQATSALLKRSGRLPDIVPVSGAAPKEVVIQNAHSWNIFDASSAANTGLTHNGAAGSFASSPEPITPGSSATTPGGPQAASLVSVDGSAALLDPSSAALSDDAPMDSSNPLWDQFRSRDAQNKLREKEIAELEERQRKEKEEKEREAKLEEERRRQAAEEEALRQAQAAEAERLKREQEIKARREAEKLRREANVDSEDTINMMEQSTIMRSMERELRQ